MKLINPQEIILYSVADAVSFADLPAKTTNSNLAKYTGNFCNAKINKSKNKCIDPTGKFKYTLALVDAYFKYAQTLFNNEISICASNYNERQIALKTKFQIFVILLALDDVSESRFPNVVKSSHSPAVYTCCLEGQRIKTKLVSGGKTVRFNQRMN